MCLQVLNKCWKVSNRLTIHQRFVQVLESYRRLQQGQLVLLLEPQAGATSPENLLTGNVIDD